MHRLATQAARASTSLFSCSCSYFTIISILHNFTSIFGCNFTSLGVILHLWGVILHWFAAFQAFRAIRAFWAFRFEFFEFFEFFQAAFLTFLRFSNFLTVARAYSLKSFKLLFSNTSVTYPTKRSNVQSPFSTSVKFQSQFFQEEREFTFDFYNLIIR